MKHQIIDTNVMLTAVTTDESISSACRQSCTQFIRRVFKGEVIVVIDDDGEVLREYRRNMYPDPNPSAGLASQFMMYVLNYQYNEARIRRVSVSKTADGSYALFPKDDNLAGFDRSDQKWVVIALSCARTTGHSPPINNATDSDWLHFEHALLKHGISVQWLCRDVFEMR